MTKLQARQPPQKNGVVLMVMTPDKASDGININPSNKTKPIDFAATGCFPKRYWQIEKRLFWVAKPSNAPTKAPVNNVTDIISLLGWYYPNLMSDMSDINLTLYNNHLACRFPVMSVIYVNLIIYGGA
jgi:hypothetical protein